MNQDPSGARARGIARINRALREAREAMTKPGFSYFVHLHAGTPHARMRAMYEDTPPRIEAEEDRPSI